MLTINTLKKEKYIFISIDHILMFSYELIAGTKNNNRYFTAIIKVENGNYVRFNDINPHGCYLYDPNISADFVMYALITINNSRSERFCKTGNFANKGKFTPSFSAFCLNPRLSDPLKRTPNLSTHTKIAY